MARPITAAAAKMRAAKSKATKDAKRRSALEDMGLMTERKKIRKPRKAMSDEQRQAAVKDLPKQEPLKVLQRIQCIQRNFVRFLMKIPFLS
jgi:hypothetical protein